MATKMILYWILVLFFNTGLNAQIWFQIYGDSVNTLTKKVFEQYDKGYLFSGAQYQNAYFANGWIMKTNINGIKLWEKNFSIDNKFVQFFGACIMPDGGMTEIGVTNKLSANCYDPFIIRLNGCFEKEWCRVYNAPGCSCDGFDIVNTPEGGYIALMYRWKSGEQQQIWLFRLDSLGEVIWTNVYATDPDFWSELSHSLLKTTDSCFVITGEAYYPDPTYPNKWIIKIILIKVNMDGEVIFEVPWGTNNGIYSDGRLSTIDSKNNIYTAGRRARKTAPFGDSPCLFKTSLSGEPVFYKDLKENSIAGIATTINWFKDSSLVFCSQWKDNSGIDTTGVIKTDSFGNISMQKVFSDNYGIYASCITFNDRLVLGGGFYSSGYLQSCAIKLNSSLEYDSIYTTPFTYDSLCPYPIVSDTVPLDDCQVVVVGIDEAQQNPETTKLKVYPNPADNRITIEMPKYLVKKLKGNGITTTTIYHQWKEVRLEVFDLFSRLVFCETVPQEKKRVTFNVSEWSPGMYVARLVFMNEVAGREKFVVE